MLEVHPCGFYAWLIHPHSVRHKNDQRQTGLIKQCWLESSGVYGYRKVYSDMRALGECIGINRVYRLMQAHSLKAQIGYRKPRHYDVNRMAESFFQLIKRRVKRKIYNHRKEARQDIFDYIELFYNQNDV